MNILALDLSLTATGWARSLTDYGTLRPPKGQDRGLPRLAWIRDRVMELAEGADVAVVEGYAYARGQRAHQIGGLGGIVRLALHEAGMPLVDIPPATLKKLATGKGNASKDAVLAEAIRRLGYAGSDDNEADALWLFELARHALDLPGAVELPKAHRAALDPERWTDITGPAEPVESEPAQSSLRLRSA